jgi:hypothetical protein
MSRAGADRLDQGTGLAEAEVALRRQRPPGRRAVLGERLAGLDR